MRVTFVSHASIMIDAQGARILCDPWFEGKVFNNGWALLTAPHTVDYSAVDYIWISHEHPDHLSFQTLKGVPEADKHRITLLYQQHASPRIVKALEKLGFSKIVELPLYRWFRLGDGVEVLCGSKGKIDSFLAVRDATACLLNLVDCYFNAAQLRYIARRVGRISIMFAQFSFANWVGNDRDEIGEAEQKIRELREYLSVLKPQLLVPFASFVYFCNAENQRMNAWTNTPRKIWALSLPGLAFMAPGDVWDSSDPRLGSERAVERYMQALNDVVIDPTPPPVEIWRIAQAAEQRWREMRAEIARQPLLRMYLMLKRIRLRRLDPLEGYVHDLAKVVVLNPADGSCRVLEASPEVADRARYVMCSQVAWYTFAFAWGGDTTEVSGMYLDRHFLQRGTHPFFIVQSAVSSESFNTPELKSLPRVARFWWRKRGEKFYEFRYEASRTAARS
jgi:UDP-MurNAc hydroxylase